jgi:hypothetical protein
MVIKKIKIDNNRWDVTTTPIWPYSTPRTEKVDNRLYVIRFDLNG